MEISSHSVRINGHSMNYRKWGKGDRYIVFLHGMPTSSYVWRNIMTKMPEDICCIAPDLIGMGESDQPDIAYSIKDHINYFEEFMHQVCSGPYTLVMHGWGSVIGFDYARKYTRSLEGLAFYEAYVKSIDHWDGLALPVQEMAADLSHQDLEHAVVHDNYLVEQFLPAGVLGGLDSQVHDVYRRPFLTEESRRVLLRYLIDAPIGRPRSASISVMKAYENVIPSMKVPKLLIYAVPGFTATMETIAWCKNYVQGLTLVDLGEAYHFAQESCPDRFAAGLKSWYEQQVLTQVKQ